MSGGAQEKIQAEMLADLVEMTPQLSAWSNDVGPGLRQSLKASVEDQSASADGDACGRNAERERRFLYSRNAGCPLP